MILYKRSVPPLTVSTDHSRLILAFTYVFLFLSIIAVILRIYARRIKHLSFVAEDYLVFIAMFGFVIQSILTTCVVIYGGAGHHQNTVSPQNIRASLQILAGQGPTFGLTLTCSKWSICLLYKRIFVARSFRILTYLTMALIFGWGILAFTVLWAFCSPVAFNWDKTIPGGHCANAHVGLLVCGIVDTITDFIILILPMPMIWRLQIPRTKRISLIVIFSIAIISIIMSGLRAYYGTLITVQDFTDSRTFLDIFSNIEPGASIIIASSLVYGPIIQRWSHVLNPSSPSPASKRTLQSFRRIHNSTEEHLTGGFEMQQTKTTVQGGEWPRAHVKGSTAGDIVVQREIIIQ